MTTDEISGQPKIPVAELEGLVEEWRREARDLRHNPFGSMARVGEGEGKGDCAEDLGELIEAYQYE